MNVDNLARITTGAEAGQDGKLALSRGWPSGTLLRVALISALVLAVVTAFQAYFHPTFSIELYLPLHSILELTSVVVSFSVFALYFNAHAHTRDARALFIGTGFLAVAILDALHTLGFLGMPDFVTPSSTEKAIYFWLAARIFASIVLLGALLLPSGPGPAYLKMRWLLLVNLGLPTLVFIYVSYLPSYLPRMFVVGQGLTPLKTGLELALAALALAGTWFYTRAAQRSGDRFYLEIAIGLVLTVFGEICMSFYTVAYDGVNLLGHVFKIAAYYFIFRGLFVTAIRKPYLALERMKLEADAGLARTIERLAESTRAERLARERAEAGIEMLRPLQTVEEAALSNRNLDELLHDLLERVRKALGADCATVFLVAEDGRELRVRASVGLDAGAREVTSIPVGAGIAGAIASRGEPMIVPNVSRIELVNAGMRGRVRAMMGVPLKSGGRVIGVVHVGAADSRQFSQPDLHLLSLVGEGVAAAVERARLYGELQATFASMASAVIVYDRGGNISRMNPAAERVFGYSPEERRLPIRERLACLRMETPDGKAVGAEWAPPTRALRGETFESDLMVIHRRGKAIWLSVSAAPVRLADGEILGAVVTFENVTPMREMEQQRSQHVLGISHGLRTPLTVMQARAQLLERMILEAGLDKRHQESARAIVVHSRRMSLVLKDLVDLTHLESGRPLLLNFESVDVGRLIRGTVARMEGEGSSRLVAGVLDDLPCIRADADRLERALASLVANGLKYSVSELQVRLSARISGEEMVISVEDRGPGLPPESLPHLFDRAERARYIPARKDTLGLGLYIAAGLVKAHGGRIWADSRLGEGSTFNIALPMAKEGRDGKEGIEGKGGGS